MLKKCSHMERLTFCVYHSNSNKIILYNAEIYKVLSLKS